MYSNPLVSRNFGAGQRVPLNDFIVFGLITFWAYSTIRMLHLLRKHADDRWRELGAPLQKGPRTEAVRRLGFVVPSIPPLIAAALFVLDGVMVLSWFIGWIWFGWTASYEVIVPIVAASSMLFYVASLVTLIWAARFVQRHELQELLLYRLGASVMERDDFEPSGELTSHREHKSNLVTLFLVLALPMAFSPTIGAHLVLTGASDAFGVAPAAICFAIAAVYHVWGTGLLVGLVNSHLATETKLSAMDSSGSESSEGQSDLAGGGAEPNGQPRRELASIMLTDIVGYSKAMERDEQSAYARLVVHNEILRATIATHRGREIKTIGDSFLVVFRSAIDAVDCALSMQRVLADYNAGKPQSDMILIRIGVHIGDVLITENDVFGDGVNVAARIEPLAEPGGICVSEEVYAIVRKRIELRIEKIEGATLKNITAAPAIFRIRAP